MTDLAYLTHDSEERKKLHRRATRSERENEEMASNIEAATSELVHTGERGLVAAGTGLAAGFLGEDYVSIGGFDLRAGTGLIVKGIGMYRATQGKADAAHLCAVADGLIVPYLAEKGVSAGQQLRAAWDGPQAAQATQVTPTPTPSPQLQGPLGPPVREVILTPPPELGAGLGDLGLEPCDLPTESYR